MTQFLTLSNISINTKYIMKIDIRSPDFQIVTDFLHPPAEVANMTNECASAPIVQVSACTEDF
jgi:hypothetical protein